jgi:hypothetical protein
VTTFQLAPDPAGRRIHSEDGLVDVEEGDTHSAVLIPQNRVGGKPLTPQIKAGVVRSFQTSAVVWSHE